jgi:glutamine amidotransferase
MCRHLAYLGPEVSLRSVIVDPPAGLYRQSWAARRQQFGTVNADGFGVGWYAHGDPVPARYRRAVPIWADESFADVARVTVSGAMLAAVRSASAGTEFSEASAAPFAADGWLFSHNGRIDGWPAAAAPVAGTLPASALLEMEARVDSALLWALVLHRLRLGMTAADALRDTITLLETASVTGRFNFLLTDGQSIAASSAGDTLCYRRAAGAVVVASEPTDDEQGWQDVPSGTILTADTSGVTSSVVSGVTLSHDGRIAIP